MLWKLLFLPKAPYGRIFDFLMSIEDNLKLVFRIIEGLRFSELNNKNILKTLMELEDPSKVWALEPLPNLIFTRDPFSTIGNGVSIHSMNKPTRRRETIFAEYIFKYNKEYKKTTQYYSRKENTSLEGGDIMILSDTNIAVGISERTQADSIVLLAKNIFADDKSNISTIWGISIPKGRSWMHLDTVFTQIDVNKFAIFSNYKFNIYKITKDNVEEISMTIDNLMKKIFGLNKVTLIHCGGQDPIHSEREQWNDGSNVLAIAPNEVIVYDRNHVTNKILKDNGVIIHEIPSYELSRGRGGPRCMSMPLERED